MKTICLLAIAALLVAADLASAQPAPGSRPGSPPAAVAYASPSPEPAPAGTKPAVKFDLNFGGGTPAELVEAIEGATKEPLNAVIRDEDKDVALPALKVRQVTVEDLFGALEQASRRRVAQVTGTYFSGFGGKGAQSQYQIAETSYGFKRQGNLWVFRFEKPVTPPDSVPSRARFYQLDAYLTRYTIDDITTAIQTAWRMTSQKAAIAQSLKFHEQTKLLIAVGEESELQVIDDVLKALLPTTDALVRPPGKAPKVPDAAHKTNAPAADPAEKP
jgi:hypothetical protein